MADSCLTKDGKPRQRAARIKRDRLGEYIATAEAFRSVLGDCGDKIGAFISEPEIARLGKLMDALEDCRALARNILEAVKPGLEALSEKQNLLEANEAMARQIEYLEAQLRANGHSDKVASAPRPRKAAQAA